MKKLLALLLALVMVFALVACNRGPVVDNSGAALYPDATYQDAPFGSDEWDGSLPIVTDGREITIGVRTQATVTDYEDNHYVNWLEEQTGFNVTIVEFAGTSADFNTQLSLMLSGNEELPHILLSTTLGGSVAKEYGREGHFVNLAGYLQHYAHYTTQVMDMYFGDEAAATEQYIIDESRDIVSGAIFSMPQMYANTNDTLMAQTVINVDWLKAVGKEIPTTVDELYDVLVAFRDKDPNGNGKKDEIPMFGRLGGMTQDIVGYVINAFVQFNMPYKFGVENGDTVFIPCLTDEYREAMKFLNKLVKEGLLSDMTFTATFNDIGAVLNPSKGEAYTVGVTATMTDSGSNFTDGHESIYKYEPIPPLKDETGRGGYAMRYAYSMSTSTYITRACECPTEAFMLLDFMNGHEAMLRSRYGVEGVDWEYLPDDIDGTGKGMFGGDAKIRLIYDPNKPYATNDNLGILCSINCENYWQVYIDPAETDPWLVEMYGDLSQQIKYYEDIGMPENFLHSMDRNEEEEEVFLEYGSELIEFMEAACAEFCTGIRDPYSDADWNAYLNEFEKLHVQESWLEVAQSCLDRKLGK